MSLFAPASSWPFNFDFNLMDKMVEILEHEKITCLGNLWVVETFDILSRLILIFIELCAEKNGTFVPDQTAIETDS